MSETPKETAFNIVAGYHNMTLGPSLADAIEAALLAQDKAATERAAKIAEDRAPATQDMRSTEISDVCDEIATAIRSQP